MQARCPKRPHRPQRGAALVFALAVVLIISFLVLGIAQFTTQHYSLASIERDATAALNAAEAAMNWELNKMARFNSADTIQSPGPPGGVLTNDPSLGPAVAGAPPIHGTVSVYVTNVSGQSNWAPPADFRIVASGTVNGVTRTIEAFGVPVGVSDRYALYGIHSLTLNNAIISGPSKNYVGTAGTCTISGSTLNGSIIFDRLDNQPARWVGTAPAWDWIATPVNSPFPSVDQIGRWVIQRLDGRSVSDPLPYFQDRENNDNDEWIKFRNSAGGLEPVVWPGSDPEHKKINEALFSQNNTNTIVLVGNDALRNGYARGSNFYLEELVIPPGKTLEILNGRETASGPNYGTVRIWLGPRDAAASEERFLLTNGSLVVHNNRDGEPDPDAFAIYNGSRSPVRLGGLHARSSPRSNGTVYSGLYGFIYSYNADTGVRFGAVRLEGDLILRGSIIGWDVTQSAGLLDAYLKPSATGSVDGAKYVLHYRLASEWREQGSLTGSGGTF